MMKRDANDTGPEIEVRRAMDLPEPGRLEGLSDGAFSIIMTLLVLEIHRPKAYPNGLLAELLAAWPSYLAYGVAFIYVGIIWMNHHYMFDRIRRIDFTFNAINLAIIGTSALIPFPTGVLADAFRDGSASDQRAATMLYALVGALMSAAWLPAFRHLHRHPELLKPQPRAPSFASQLARPIVGMILYCFAAAIGWFAWPSVAVGIFIIVVVYYAWTSQGVRVTP